MLNSQVYIKEDIKESIGRKRAHNYELKRDDLEGVADNLYTLHDQKSWSGGNEYCIKRCKL